jgi:hypothetical protein
MHSNQADSSQVNPVPMKPRVTLLKRVMDSARDSGWAQTAIKDKVPSRWCDPENVHVFVYAYRGVGEPSSRYYPDV